ncbi:MAG: hypothetical protein N3H31_01225 [Candidatus Nezhaarchaeota archaeon]|nr:hypothetical protein [Candidatus Nezhaarchaeota archaeon]
MLARLHGDEMSKRLAIYASKIKDYLTISEALRDVDVDFDLLDPSNPVLDKVDVIVTSKEEAERFRGLKGVRIVEAEACKVSTIAKVILALQEKERFKELLIGIDPGRNYGVALIADSTIIGLGVYHEAEEVVKKIEAVVGTGLFEKVMVKVGNGSPEHRNKILPLIREHLRGVEVRLVSEKGTSSPPLFFNKNVPRDAASAFYLALKG